MKRCLGLAVLALPILTIACASKETPVESGPPAIGDLHSFVASAETRAELGIAVWGVSGEHTTVRFTGYDQNGSALAVLERRVDVPTASNHRLDVELRGAIATARLQIDGVVAPGPDDSHVDVTVNVTENTFPDSPRAAAVLERMGADIASNQSGPLLAKDDGIRARGLLTGECLSLLGDCVMTLVQTGRELLPCTAALRAMNWTYRCAVGGAVIGGAVTAPGGPAAIAGAAGGFLVGGGFCAWLTGVRSLVEQCADVLQDFYENGNIRSDMIDRACDVKKACD